MVSCKIITFSQQISEKTNAPLVDIELTVWSSFLSGSRSFFVRSLFVTLQIKGSEFRSFLFLHEKLQGLYS